MNAAVLITGSNGGIGAALVNAFAAAGWRVIGADLAAPKTKTATASITVDLQRLVDDEKALAAFRGEVLAASGGGRLKAVVNNAATQILGETEALGTAEMMRSLAINTVAPFLLAKTFLPELEANRGSIVNIGSVHAAATKRRFAAYATSKAALHGLTRALAVDLGGRVRVNTLAPAAVATDMLKAGFAGKPDKFAELEACHPSNRIASPEEIAKLALFLVSDEADFINGATLYADGGVLSRLHDPD